MTMKICFTIHGGKYTRDLPPSWVLVDVMNGFWLNRDFQLTKGSDAFLWIPPSCISWVAKGDPKKHLIRNLSILAAFCAIIFVMGGCASTAETTWQVLHAVDVAQTLNGPVREPCFEEQDRLTRAIIGRQPSAAGTLAWGVTSAGLHLYVSRMLEDGPQWLYAAWQGVSIGAAGFTVANNHSNGIRPIGGNQCAG